MADRTPDPGLPSFLGPPGRLRLTQPPDSKAGPATAAHLPDALLPYADPRRPVLRTGRDPRRTRLRLSPQTPPGDYPVGIEYADGRKAEVTVHVQARPRLRVLPGTLRLAGAPSALVAARLLVENRGNEVLDIPESLVTGIFDNGGIEAALAAVYRLETDDLNRIVSTGFARLREAHGGLLRLRVREGAGRVAPGESRALLLETTLSSKLAPRHGYHGTLELGSHRIAVQVAVADAPSDKSAGEPR